MVFLIETWILALQVAFAAMLKLTSTTHSVPAFDGD